MVVMGTTNKQEPPQQVLDRYFCYLQFVLIIIDVDYVEQLSSSTHRNSNEKKKPNDHPKWYAMIYYFAKSLIPLTYFIF
jgi:hypothetical protein